MSDFNHFSIRRGNETHIVQKRKTEILRTFFLLTVDLRGAFKVIKITFSRSSRGVISD